MTLKKLKKWLAAEATRRRAEMRCATITLNGEEVPVDPEIRMYLLGRAHAAESALIRAEG